MKDYIEERAVEIAEYIIENKGDGATDGEAIWGK